MRATTEETQRILCANRLRCALDVHSKGEAREIARLAATLGVPKPALTIRLLD